MKYLDVFEGLRIPVDYASTQTYALLARRDGGKTYTTLKIEEQMCDAGLFFVTIDPVGKHWALRAGKSGSARGGKPDVWVLGGLHGDVPLEATSGELIADVVVDHPGRYVLDVSTFETDAEQDRFALAFAQRLFRRKARDPGFPILLILEEAEAFIPERPQPGQAKMLGAYGRIMRQGRNHGLGMLMVAQRGQALNKGVLSQAEVLIVKQMAHNRDIGAVDEWIKSNGTPDQRSTLLGSLASLEQNEAWVWSPSWLRCFQSARVLPRVTFDSSKSVKGGEEARRVDLVPLDVEALGAQIESVAERAKDDDPKALRRRVRELEAELAKAPAAEPERVEVPVEVQVPIVADPEKLERLGTRFGRFASEARVTLEELAKWQEHFDEQLAEIATAPSKLQQSAAIRAPNVTRGNHAPPRPRAKPSRPVSVSSPGSAAANNGEGLTLGKAHRAILSVLAQFAYAGRSKRQLAMLAGYSAKGGGFNNALSALRSQGMVDQGDPIRILQPGMDVISGQFEPLPQGPELLDYWLGQVNGAARTILEHLATVGGGTKEDVAAATGYSPSGGGFNNALSRLRTLQLIEGRGELALTEEFAEALA